MNPMIRKELRQRMRERRGWLLPSLYLVVLSAVVAFAYYVTTSERPWSAPAQGSTVGVTLFLVLAYAQLAVLLLMAPIFSSGSITIEKEQKTLAGLLTSLLTSGEIWWGKFVSSLLFVLLLLITSLPVLSMAFGFGGIGIWEVFSATVTTVLILATTSAIGLYCSSAFQKSIHATAVTYAVMLTMSVVTAILFFLRISMLESGGGRTNGGTWAGIPLGIRLPMYFNPFFFLTTSFATPRGLYPAWVTCAGVFVAILVVAMWGTVRNLQRKRDA